jgi:hypothetical protein
VAKNLYALRTECWIATGLVLSLVINISLLSINSSIERSRAQASNQQPQTPSVANCC